MSLKLFHYTLYEQIPTSIKKIISKYIIPLQKKKNTHKYIPDVKNSLLRSSSTFGRHLGSGWSVARIILMAELDICEDAGILYSHLFIREYVSFSELVSNGGFPINNVYLGNKICY